MIILNHCPVYNLNDSKEACFWGDCRKFRWHGFSSHAPRTLVNRKIVSYLFLFHVGKSISEGLGVVDCCNPQKHFPRLINANIETKIQLVANGR